MIKKLVLIILAVVIIAVAVVLIRLGAIASSVVKNAINEYGPELTQTAVSVEEVSIKPYIGSATIEDLKVGNPSGYKAPNAFTLKKVHVSLSPTSLLDDTIVIHTIEIDEPFFVYESNLLSSNISSLMDTIKANTSKTNKAAEKAAEKEEPGTDTGTQQKQFVINKLEVTNGTVQIGVLGQTSTVALPDIKLENFSPEGITAAQASNEILNAILSKVIVAATDIAAKAATDPTGAAKGITDTALDTAGDVGKEIGGAIDGLFGGKKDSTTESK